MTRMILCAVSCVAALASSSRVCDAGLVYIDDLYGVQKSQNVQYGVGATQAGTKALYADIYQPVDIGNGPVPVNRPAIVIQDGGAWTSARKDRGRVTTPAEYLTKRGYTVIVTDYRQGAPGVANPLFPFIGSQWLTEPGPDAPVIIGQTQFGNAPYAGLNTNNHTYAVYPQMTAIAAGIEDFAVAIDWTRTNAASLGIDPDRIGIAGGSAGGIDGLLLQYNNNPVDPRYAAQAVVALVSTMMDNWDHIQPGGPPVFLLNNTADAVVPWSPDMSQRFVDMGIYREQWYQPTDLIYHDVDWNLIPNSVASPTALTEGPDLQERVRDFLAYQLAGGPYLIPEPSSLVLGLLATTAFVAVPLRRRMAKRARPI